MLGAHDVSNGIIRKLSVNLKCRSASPSPGYCGVESTRRLSLVDVLRLAAGGLVECCVSSVHLQLNTVFSACKRAAA